MKDDIIINIEGLQPLPSKAPGETKDFSFAAVFGSTAPEALPVDDFFVSDPLRIKDQGPVLDFCAMYAGAAVSEDQEGVELSPEYGFQIAKRLMGGDSWKKWGLNLRDAATALTSVGLIEQKDSPFPDHTQFERDYLANPENWPKDLDALAWEHAKNSFFDVDGPHDTFDNYVSAMWINRSEHRSILTGALWCRSWTLAPGGFIDIDTAMPDEKRSGHAFKVFGQINTKGKLWLVAQLSNGADIGDKGLFYFSRAVVNKEFVFGAFTFKDMPKGQAAYHSENGIPLGSGLWYKAWRVFITIIKNLIS